MLFLENTWDIRRGKTNEISDEFASWELMKEIMLDNGEHIESTETSRKLAYAHNCRTEPWKSEVAIRFAFTFEGWRDSRIQVVGGGYEMIWFDVSKIWQRCEKTDVLLHQNSHTSMHDEIMQNASRWVMLAGNIFWNEEERCFIIDVHCEHMYVCFCNNTRRSFDCELCRVLMIAVFYSFFSL